MKQAIHKLVGSYLQKLKGNGIGAILLRGASGAFIIQVLGAGIAITVQMLLARMMGAEHYGIYTYALTWINILVLLGKVGLDTTLLRYMAAYNARKEWSVLRGLWGRSNQLVLITSVIVSSSSALVIWLLQERLDSELSQTFWIACVLLPVLALLGLRQSALRSLRRVVLAQIPGTILRPLLLAGSVVVYFYVLGQRVDGTRAMLFNLLTAMVVFAVANFWLRKALPTSLKRATPKYKTREWLRVSLPLLLVSGMRIILNRTDIVLIGIVVGTTEAGIYAVASRMAQLVTFGLTAGNMIAAPLISELYSQGKITLLQRTVTLTAWGATISSIFIGILLIFGKTAVLEMFGKEFVMGDSVLLILVTGQLINACTGPVGYLLNMTGYQDVNAKIIFCIVCLNILLNYPAIMLWGINGAALVTSVLIALKNIWTWYEVRRRIGINSSVFNPIILVKP